MGNANVEIKRILVIEKSSYMRRNEIDFEIVAQGVRGKHWLSWEMINKDLMKHK